MPGTPQKAYRPFLVVSAGHLAIDIFNSMGPVLLAFLRTPLALTGAQIGFAAGLYQFLAGTTQPPFGWIADRIGSRWLGPLSVAWTIGLVTAALHFGLSSESYGLFLLLFALAACGSGAFHPQGTMHSGQSVARHSATFTAVFFLCGQMGLATGPALAGILLDNAGTSGISWLALIAVPVALLMFWGLRDTRPLAPEARDPAGSRRGWREFPHRPVALLLFIFTCRGWVQIGTATFLPILFASRGMSGTAYGSLAGLYWLGAGIAGVVAGGLADRIGRRSIVAGTSLLGAVGLFFLPGASMGWAFPMALVTGALVGAPHSILIVMAQAILPVRRGLASGLALGYLFFAGAIGNYLMGVMADIWRLELVLQATAFIAVAVAAVTFWLPQTTATVSEDELQPATAP